MSPSLPWLDLKAFLRAIHLSLGYPHCPAFLQITQDSCTPGLHPGKSYLPPRRSRPLMQPHPSVPWTDHPAVACRGSFVLLATLGGHIGIPARWPPRAGGSSCLPLSVYISLSILLLISLRPCDSFRYWKLYITSNPPPRFHYREAKMLWSCSSTSQSPTASWAFLGQNSPHFSTCECSSRPAGHTHPVIHFFSDAVSHTYFVQERIQR